MDINAQVVDDPTGFMSGAAFAHPHAVQISCYDNEVPAFVIAEIDRLYGHLYCSPSYFLMAKEMVGASTYVAVENNAAVSILLYKLAGNAVMVIGQFMNLRAEDINRFAEHIFNRFPLVKMISFSEICKIEHALAYPSHEMTCSEDMVINLPATVRDYESAVGKNMRRNIKRYTKALVDDFPSYQFRILVENEIGDQDIRDIIALSCSRMKSKNIVPRFNEEEERWIVEHARRCGVVGMATVDGRVCAGAIGFRIGENYMMHVIAHDLKYNEYSLGILCYYHTICDVIARGGKRFHLLQGRYGYKYRLLADRHDIVHLDVFRSHFGALRHSRRILKKEIKGRLWLTKQWLLHDVEREEGKAYRFLGSAVNALRTAKRSRGSLEE
ncbi:GNAT family N-acetyltransferase [Noviherbaspirillum saxi]|uniref:GNAT family N-acetyltransferase n=1 Tax=Noviherbaspirillum saxi TaxID=2320863 RepID=A0A3A3FI94_9BURK|nr:GNAT family N-acetyltransferase [Noviherbaspirillum saxi]RJF95223.1 GNAT family N-acetyltransferase [Noviherbaspirillum saxi]